MNNLICSEFILFESICVDAGAATDPIPERNVWPLQFPSF
jgi:hypothetical protein